MKIEVHLFATLARYLPAGSHRFMEVGEGTTVRDLLVELGVPQAEVKLIFLNGVHAGLDTVLEDGGRLGIFPPVGGG